MAERNPLETVRNNVLGTGNVARAADRARRVHEGSWTSEMGQLVVRLGQEWFGFKPGDFQVSEAMVSAASHSRSSAR